MAQSIHSSFFVQKKSPGEYIIGILGGMGPQASVDLLSKLVSSTKVVSEQDHLHILLDVNPKVPDRNLALKAGRLGNEVVAAKPGIILGDMARKLADSGATLLIMACNTAHAFEKNIRDATDVPFLSMIEEVCSEVHLRAAPDAKSVGILVTQGCLDAGLYQNALERRGIKPVMLDTLQQMKLMHLIYKIKFGDLSSTVRSEMLALVRCLRDAGADAIIAGCTEVPLVMEGVEFDFPVLDATLILARRCVRYARRQEALPAYCFS